jgi:hypothetical protein
MNCRTQNQVRSNLAGCKKAASTIVTNLKNEGRLTNASERSQKTWTPRQVEQSVLRALASVVEARGGSAHTFAEWTLSGHGVVLRLPNGQEYWCTIAEAGY